MNRPSWLLGLLAAVVVAGCARSPEPESAAVQETGVQEEEITNANLPEPATTAVPEDAAAQAGILAEHIDPRPECAEFLQPLQAASMAAPGSPESSIDMTDIMRRAQAASCTRK